MMMSSETEDVEIVKLTMNAKENSIFLILFSVSI